ncbi:MAG TPA: phosphoenolpyruvate--protein phosphotransferase [Candidatus Limnocylindrales bacterium]|nr:phosphoenolpyruvate--protein phosphotransferase [Candidatus Limnocylindrales bacterium]
MFKGIGVAPGIVIGRAFRLDHPELEINPSWIRNSEVEEETDRFRKAVERAKADLEEVKKKLEGQDNEQAKIIEVHLMLLEDSTLVEETVNYIKKYKVSAEWALKQVIDRFKANLAHAETEYLRERQMDITHAGNSILRNLIGYEENPLDNLKEDVIVVAYDLSPSDTVQMSKERVIGFVTDAGSKTSHSAIMAHSLGIPAVVGVAGLYASVDTGDLLIVDGTEGIVIVNPSSDVLEVYLEKQRQYDYEINELLRLKDLPALTLDFQKVSLLANVELLKEVDLALKYGAEGIGLYRTEFLYLNRHDLPSEEEHFQVYKTLAERIAPNSAIIRTIDLGGEKVLSPLDIAGEKNPVLGLRAIRLCLTHKDLFKTQLRAILRASQYGKLQIMYPMISGVDELKKANAILDEVKEELDQEGIPYDKNIPVGIMVEVPSAAIIADFLAKEVDFFSIGTNDLIQYCLAIDRENEKVAYLYEPYHPSILRLLAHIIKAGHEENIPVGMCGEMAGDPKYTVILLGLGLDSFSMNADSLLKVKRVIRSVTLSQAEKVAKEVLSFTTSNEIQQYLDEWMMKHFPDLIR